MDARLSIVIMATMITSSSLYWSLVTEMVLSLPAGFSFYAQGIRKSGKAYIFLDIYARLHVISIYLLIKYRARIKIGIFLRIKNKACLPETETNFLNEHFVIMISFSNHNY